MHHDDDDDASLGFWALARSFTSLPCLGDLCTAQLGLAKNGFNIWILQVTPSVSLRRLAVEWMNRKM